MTRDDLTVALPLRLVLVLTACLVVATAAEGADRTVCASGCDHTTLQAAVDAAAAGDNIILTSGESFHQTTALQLPTTQHASVVTIKSSTACPNRRVTPADASLMATITSANAEAAIEGVGVKNWKFDCVRFFHDAYTEDAAIFLLNANLGGGSFRNTDGFTLDRVLIEGGSSGSWEKGVYLHGANITLTRSYIHNIRNPGRESKGFLSHDGPGPYTITDTYIEAASINVLFGGADQSSSAHIPDNITFTGNHLFKRPEWANVGLAVKNLFELKCATDVTVENNLMENNYIDGQNGTAVLFTARNDDNNSPWSTVQNVSFKKNIVRNSPIGLNLLGLNDGSATVRATNLTISENLWILNDRFMTAGGEVGTVVIEHNTIQQGGHLMVLYESGLVWEQGGSQRASTYAINNMTFRNNIAWFGAYGVQDADGQGFATDALNADVNTYTWSHNVLPGGPAGQTYPNSSPSSFYFPAVSVLQADLNPDYTLKAASAYNNAGSDSLDIGWFGGNTPPGGGDPPGGGGPPVGGGGSSGVVHISTTNAPQDLGCTACTHTFTVAQSGTLIVRVGYFGATDLLTSVTTNPNGTGAVALTEISECAGGPSNDRRASIWRLNTATNGSNLVTVNFASATSNSIGVSEYTGVDGYGTPACAGGDSTTATVTAAVTHPEAQVIDVVRWGFSENRTATPAQGQTQRWYEVAAAASDRLATVPNTVMTWTINDGGAPWAHLAVALNPVIVPSVPLFRVRIRGEE